MKTTPFFITVELLVLQVNGKCSLKQSSGEDTTTGPSGSSPGLHLTPDLSALTVSQICWLPTVLMGCRFECHWGCVNGNRLRRLLTSQLWSIEEQVDRQRRSRPDGTSSGICCWVSAAAKGRGPARQRFFVSTYAPLAARRRAGTRTSDRGAGRGALTRAGAAA